MKTEDMSQVLKQAKKILEDQKVSYPFLFYFCGMVYRVEKKGQKPFPEDWAHEPIILTKNNL